MKRRGFFGLLLSPLTLALPKMDLSPSIGEEALGYQYIDTKFVGYPTYEIIKPPCIEDMLIIQMCHDIQEEIDRDVMGGQMQYM